MNRKTLLILGGYGNTGAPLSRLLMEFSDACLIIAGRDPEKAASAVKALNDRFPGERAMGRKVDAASASDLKDAFSGIDMVVLASSTSLYVKSVVEHALEAGIDYLDIQFSSKKVSVLKSLAPEIESAGRCFITEGGFHPGLPAALVRYAAPCFDQLESAIVGSVIKIDWRSLALSEATVDELVNELLEFDMRVYKDSAWVKASLMSTRDFKRMDFDKPFGRQMCSPMFLEEMATIPEQFPRIKDTGFYVGGFNWFVDWFVLPVGVLAMKIAPRKSVKPVGMFMLWGLRTFSNPPFGTILKLEAGGKRDGRNLTLEVALSHEDGYMFTAIPVAATLLQYLDGSIARPGLWTQANLVEPVRMLDDMRKMGVQIIEREALGDR